MSVKEEGRQAHGRIILKFFIHEATAKRGRFSRSKIIWDGPYLQYVLI